MILASDRNLLVVGRSSWDRPVEEALRPVENDRMSLSTANKSTTNRARPVVRLLGPVAESAYDRCLFNKDARPE